MSFGRRPLPRFALLLEAAVALSVAAGCAPAGDAEQESDAAQQRASGEEQESSERHEAAAEQEVRLALESYYDAFSDRDWPRFAQHFWSGATLTTVWAPPGETMPRVVATSVPEFIAQAPEGPGSREIFEERMVSAEITVKGELAQAWARYEARFGDPGEVMEWEGLDAFTLIRHYGEWRITSLAYAADSD